MIRGNYSLAAEFRKNELKQQNKIQQRQKHKHNLEKLSNVDPIRLHRQIKRLEQEPRDKYQDKKLQKLKDDWNFVVKNGIKKKEVEAYLAREETVQKQKQKEKSKLWGQKSIYFNPELNPLGKVPDAKNITLVESKEFPNLTKPLRNKQERDPSIDSLGIVLPEGDPPKYYKEVQNTRRKNEQNEGKEQDEEKVKKTNEDNEDFAVSKKPRYY